MEVDMKFKFEDYKGNYCMHCKTEEEAIEFCKLMHENGRTWRNGNSYLEKTERETFKDKTCYCFNDDTYIDLNYASSHDFKILEWSDFQEDRTCEFCKYQLFDANEYPCTICCNRYTNKFERKITRQDKFLEMYPNTRLDGYKVIGICPYDIGEMSIDKCEAQECCLDCKKKYWHEEVE